MSQLRNDVTVYAASLVNGGQSSQPPAPTLATVAAQLQKTLGDVAGWEVAVLDQAIEQAENRLDQMFGAADALYVSFLAYLFPSSTTPARPSVGTSPPVVGSAGGAASSGGGGHGHQPASSNDPLYVLDMNTGETVPANVPLNTFSTWGENLLAQASGGAVSSYAWNVSQAPDLTNVSGTATANLQGTWTSFTGAAHTDTITVTATPQSGQPMTQTMTFLVAGTDSPAYSASRPTSSSTWPSAVTPDQVSSGQATQAAGPYANIGLADGSAQTSFSMPSYNPNITPVSLDYNSTTANAQPIFLAEYQLPFGQSVPATITAQLTFNNTPLATVTYNTANLNPGDIVQIALQANATGLTTGRYPWSITVSNGTNTNYSGNVNIVNQASSPFGAGWSLDNVEQLVPVADGVILVQPGGTSLWFASNGPGAFTTPAGDFSTLTYSSGVYTRTLTDGTQINFNSSGQQTSTVDRDGNTTTFNYSGGLLTSITDMNGQVTTLAYSGGLLSSITDPANRTATLAYSGKQLTSITDPANDVWQYAYDSSNDLTTLTDPNNHTTTFNYNFADRVSSVTQPDGSTEELTAEQMNGLAAPGTGTPSNPATAVLLAAGDTAQYTDPNNNVWLTGLDWLGFGQDVADIDPLGDASLNYLNANGLAWLSADALGRRTREFFDSNGNPTEIVNPDDTYAQYQYNSFSEPTLYTNELGDITIYAYNNKGDLTQETNALGYSTTYAYNAAGLVTSMTNANNNTWSYSYDTLNRKVGETDPLKYTQTWAYDSASDQTSYTNQNGAVSTYAYDPMGRMTSETLPDSGTTTSTYTFTYDKVGNQTSETAPITSTQTATTYDKYDAMNRLSSETDPLGDVTKYSYDANGNQISVTNPLGYVTTYTYDADNRQTGATIPLSGSGPSQVTATTTYGYDAAGEQTSKTDALGDVWKYSYNSRGWLSSTTEPTGDQTNYGYDAVGNQTSKTQVLAVGTPPNVNYTYYTTTTAYDAIGEKIQEICAPPGGTTPGSFFGNFGSNFSGSYSGTLGGSLSGSFSGSVGGSITDASGYTGTITGTFSGSLNGSISSGGSVSGSFSGSGTFTISGGISASGTFSISGSLSGQNLGGSGSITGMIVATISGTTSSTGSDSGSLSTSGNTTLGLSGGGNGQGTSSGSFSGYEVGPTTTYTYDPVGNLTGQDGPGGCGGGGCSCGSSGTMTYAYDADNRQTSMADGAGDTTNYSYDGVGNQTQVTDPLGNPTNFTYDAQNRLLSTTNALNGTTSYAYNLAGWQTSETDPDNNVTQYGYNAAGEMTSETNPLGYQQTFSYDTAGQLTAKTDYNGQQTQYSYNEAGWKTGETWLNGQNQAIYQATYTYDNAGRLASEQDANSLYNYSYDSSGEMTQAVVTYPGVSNSPLVTLSYGYDSVGNRTSLSDSLGGSLSYGYNGEHQLTSEAFALNGTAGPQLSLTYDSQERLSGITRTDGAGDTIASSYSYDAASRLTNLMYTNTTQNVTLANYTYGYDSASQVSSYQDTNSSLTYGYDKTGQLLSASGTLNGSNYSASWTYDANGNRNMSGYQTGIGNELLSDGTYNYTYDKNGNTLTKTNIATGDEWFYTWDYHNQMTEAVEKTKGGVVENDEKYTYDVEGRLIGVNVNGTQQRWTVFDGANAYMDFNGAGTVVTERYVTNPMAYGTLYARVSGTADWYVTDNLGSIRLIVDTSGNLLDAIVYDPWGNIVSESNVANGDRFKFDGGEYDMIAGQYHFGARWYEAGDGRFESQDPLGLSVEQNLNLFAYNDPTNYFDKNGLIGIFFGGAGQLWGSGETMQILAKHDYDPGGVHWFQTPLYIPSRVSGEMQEAYDIVMKAVRKAEAKGCKEPVDIFGWSRGGMAAIGLSWELSGSLALEDKRVEVEFLGLIDPVPRAVTWFFPENKIPGNVRIVFEALKMKQENFFKDIGPVIAMAPPATTITIKRYPVTHAQSGFDPTIRADLAAAAVAAAVPIDLSAAPITPRIHRLSDWLPR